MGYKKTSFDVITEPFHDEHFHDRDFYQHLWSLPIEAPYYMGHIIWAILWFIQYGSYHGSLKAEEHEFAENSFYLHAHNPTR